MPQHHGDWGGANARCPRWLTADRAPADLRSLNLGSVSLRDTASLCVGRRGGMEACSEFSSARAYYRTVVTLLAARCSLIAVLLGRPLAGNATCKAGCPVVMIH